MEFEWDATKAKANRDKHRVGFEDAKAVFNDLMSITFPDPQHSEMERRHITIGAGGTGNLLLVAHTDRESRVRIINARRATARERRRYEEGH